MKDYPVHMVQIPNGETLAYRTAGTGATTVVLIHGNMSSSVHWQTTMEALEDTFTVYAPDMRGLGDSSYNKGFDSLHELALDLEAFMDAVGIGRCSLVGWSTGGGVALEIAADRPDQISTVVLVDSVPPTGYPMFAKDENGQPIFTQLLSTKEEIAADPIQVVPMLDAYAAGDKQAVKTIWDAVIYNLHTPPAEEYDRYLDATLKQRSLVDVDYALVHFNMTDTPTGVQEGSGRLDLVSCPVVVFHGEKDVTVPLAWGQATLAALGDRGRMVTFPDSGHSPITDEPEAFRKALVEALK